MPQVLIWYLAGVNVLGFLLYLLYEWIAKRNDEENGKIDILLIIISILGGTLGQIISWFVTGRRAKKSNMLPLVFMFVMFVIDVVALLYYLGFHDETLDLNIINFFSEHKYVIIYLVVINIITIIAYAKDKINAAEHRIKDRIRIVTLLGLAFIGGSIGAMISMYCFHHKTKQPYFYIGVPLILVMQIVVIFYLMNVL